MATKSKKPKGRARSNKAGAETKGAAPRRLNRAELRALNAWFQVLPQRLQTKALAVAGSKALSDSEFRRKLLAEPRKTLKAAGLRLPAGVKLETFEANERKLSFALPPLGGIPKPKVIIRDQDLKAAYEGDDVGMGDTDTVAGNFKDPTAVTDVVVNDGAVGDVANSPPGRIDIRKVPAKGDAGRDPHPAKDNFWSDA